MALSRRLRAILKIAMADSAAAKEMADAIDNVTTGGLTANNSWTGNNTFGTGTLTLNNGATLGAGKDIATGTTTGSAFGHTAAQKTSLHGATPVIQRAGAAQAAVTSTVAGAVAGTGATSTTPFGYAQAQADAIVTNLNALRVDSLAAVALVNELRAALAEKGVIKGAA